MSMGRSLLFRDPKLAWIGILIDCQRGRGVLDEKK